MARSNPKGRFLDTDDYALQLFVPRQEIGWQGLDVAKEEQYLVGGQAIGAMANKPRRILYTSTLKWDGAGFSDWLAFLDEGLLAGEREPGEWRHGHGVVLRVLPGARVMHIVSPRDLDRKLLLRYGQVSYVPWDGDPESRFVVAVDWEEVAKDYDGIHIEGEAVSDPWLAAWDVESTGWFNLDVLEEAGVVPIPGPRAGQKKRQIAHALAVAEKRSREERMGRKKNPRKASKKDRRKLLNRLLRGT